MFGVNHEIIKRLTDPFPPELVQWKVGATNKEKTRALAMAYVDARAFMDRLDDVLGPENWVNEYAPGPSGSGVICGVSILFDYGSGAPPTWITKWDGAGETDFESVKGGLTDSFKRACYRWGLGRYLYDIPSTWVKAEERYKRVELLEIPTIPPEFVPGGKKQGNRPHLETAEAVGTGGGNGNGNPSPEKPAEARKTAPTAGVDWAEAIKQGKNTFGPVFPEHGNDYNAVMEYFKKDPEINEKEIKITLGRCQSDAQRAFLVLAGEVKIE